MRFDRLQIPILVFFAIFILLSLVQVKVENPMLILERFIVGGGWIEISFISLYGSFVAYKMQDADKQAVWRVRAWNLFSIVFFMQLFLGVIGFEKFLMTGKLHLPIPMMIVAGPLYRMQISFMPILFLSTILLSGPAWCSQLCYFGSIDATISKQRKIRHTNSLKWLMPLKFTGLSIVILAAVLFRLFSVPVIFSTILAGLFGIIGLVVILYFSRREGRMIHCITYCPIGTVVSYIKYINPFRFKISDSCTGCMRCVPECKYGALTQANIAIGKPGITCTLCGDCQSVCKPNSFYYKFPGLGPVASKNLYIGITIVLHAVFLALARI